MHEQNQILAHFLRNIPQSNQDWQTLAELVSSADTIPILAGTLQMLQLFGIVQVQQHNDYTQIAVKASSQTAKYALESLASFIETETPIIPNWKKRGTTITNPNEVLETGAKFLYILEHQRMKLLENPPASRTVETALVLIKRTNPETGEAELLFEWDEHAREYQLIGGRRSDTDENNLQTIIREIAEELPDYNLSYGQDYQLSLLIKDLQPTPMISPTFGALTQYKMNVYHLRGLQTELNLDKFKDHWATIEDVLKGFVTTPSGKKRPFNTPETYHIFDQAIRGGFLGLPDSFD